MGSEAEARRIIQQALPHAQELFPATAGQAYSSPPPGVKAWFQVHPAEPAVGNLLPHLKYADWTGGKKGTGGTWGHLFFPQAQSGGVETMSFMFEVLYKSPPDARREAVISEQVGQLGGRLTYREGPDPAGFGPICLTYEFKGLQEAQEAASRLRADGEHVEGPMDYGD